MAVAVASPEDDGQEIRRLRAQVESLNDHYVASSTAHAHTLVYLERLRTAMQAVAATDEAIRLYGRDEAVVWLVKPALMDELRAAAEAADLPPLAVPEKWTAEDLNAWETRARAALMPLLATAPRRPAGRGATDEATAYLGRVLQRLDEPN